MDVHQEVQPEMDELQVMESQDTEQMVGNLSNTLKDLQKKEKMYQSGKAYLERKIQEYESRLTQMKIKKERNNKSKGKAPAI